MKRLLICLSLIFVGCTSHKEISVEGRPLGGSSGAPASNGAIGLGLGGASSAGPAAPKSDSEYVQIAKRCNSATVSWDQSLLRTPTRKIYKKTTVQMGSSDRNAFITAKGLMFSTDVRKMSGLESDFRCRDAGMRLPKRSEVETAFADFKWTSNTLEFVQIAWKDAERDRYVQRTEVPFASGEVNFFADDLKSYVLEDWFDVVSFALQDDADYQAKGASFGYYAGDKSDWPSQYRCVKDVDPVPQEDRDCASAANSDPNAFVTVTGAVLHRTQVPGAKFAVTDGSGQTWMLVEDAAREETCTKLGARWASADDAVRWGKMLGDRTHLGFSTTSLDGTTKLFPSDEVELHFMESPTSTEYKSQKSNFTMSLNWALTSNYGDLPDRLVCVK
jgi:hypothetical protein